MMTGPVNAFNWAATASGVMLSAPTALNILTRVRMVLHASAEKTFDESLALRPFCPETSTNALESAAVASVGSVWAIPYTHCGRSPPSPCATSGDRQIGVATTGLVTP